MKDLIEEGFQKIGAREHIEDNKNERCKKKMQTRVAKTEACKGRSITLSNS